MTAPSIHPSAIVSPRATIGSNVEIGPFCIIHANVTIGSNTRIDAYSEIGIKTNLGDSSPLSIGPDSHIRSHAVFYESSKLGPGLITGHRVCVRELTEIGRNAQLGSGADIQGHCTIGDFFKTHNSVHIGQKSKIGNFVWMFPEVLLTNDPNPPSNNLIGPEVGDFSVIAAKTVLLPGVKIGKNCFIGASSLVGIDIPDEKMASGNPAIILGNASIIRMKDDIRIRAYPWNKRFHRGYPDDIILSWKES